MKAQVDLVDVTLRDGLQLLTNIPPTGDKLLLLRELADAGIQRLELGSFVSSKLLPQFADTAEIVEAATLIAGIRGAVLVPNTSGFRRAVAAGTREVVWVVSASETHNQSNLRRTVDQSLNEFASVIQEASDRGIYIRLAVATAFHCPFEGPIAIDAVLHLIDRTTSLGKNFEILLADTFGRAVPVEVYNLITAVRERFDAFPVAFHAHDTMGRGVVNIEAAYEAGCLVFDGALAGLGGCPYAPGATGNVSIEEINMFFTARGIETGLSVPGLVKAAAGARRFTATEPSMPSNVSI